MSVSSNFIKRPIGTSLLAIAIMLVGIAAWPLLPVAPLPQVDFPTIQVTANLPGANPETIPVRTDTAMLTMTRLTENSMGNVGIPARSPRQIP